MAVNSEGIYATRPWKIYGEGPSTQVAIKSGGFNEDKRGDFTAEDVRFTTKGSTLYAFVMGWPEKEALVRALAKNGPQNPGKIHHVKLLGYTGQVKWKQDESGLKASKCSAENSPISASL